MLVNFNMSYIDVQRMPLGHVRRMLIIHKLETERQEKENGSGGQKGTSSYFSKD